MGRMGDADIERLEELYDLSAEYLERRHLCMEAIDYIDEFKAVFEYEEDYADLLLVEEKIVEYQEVYVNYKNNSTDELKIKIDSLETIIIDISKKLYQQSSSIPLTEKKKITVKDFELLYSIPEETQSRMRGRHKDPLPHTQFSARGNIYYDPKEVDKWMENYQK